MIDLNEFRRRIYRIFGSEESLLEVIDRAISAESERDELKSKLAELESQKPAKEKSRKYDPRECCDVVVIEVPIGFPIYARPIPPQPIANNSEPVGSPDEVGGGKSRNNECRLIGNELSELAVLIFNGEAGSSQNILDELRKLVYKLWDLTSPTPDSVIAQRDELQAALNQVTSNKAEVPEGYVHVDEVIQLCKDFSSRTGSIYIGDVQAALSSPTPLKGDDK